MAKKSFFNKKVKKTYKGPSLKLILYIIGGALVLTILTVLTVAIVKKSRKEVVIEIKDPVTVEINSGVPNTNDLFKKLKNIDIKDITVSYENVDFANLGSYELTVKVKDQEFNTTLEVVDNTMPNLVVDDLVISKGSKYKITDFVVSCTDNSGEECILNYPSDEYKNITDLGEHNVLIVASDASGNNTGIKKVKLSIVDGKACRYGTGGYDTKKYIMAVDITSDGCAIDLNLYYEESTMKPAKKFITKETDSIQNYIETIDLGFKNIKVSSELYPILNTSGKGVVGYEVEMHLANRDTNEEFAVYKVNKNGNRVYSLNTYNLKK